MKSGSLTACRGVSGTTITKREWEKEVVPAPSLVYPVGRIDRPGSTALDLVGPGGVGTNSVWGLFFWWGITNLVFTSVDSRNHEANSLERLMTSVNTTIRRRNHDRFENTGLTGLRSTARSSFRTSPIANVQEAPIFNTSQCGCLLAGNTSLSLHANQLWGAHPATLR